MTDNRKLPLSFQFVLLTAALVFSYAAYRIATLSYGLWVSWDEIQATNAAMDWSSVYVPALRHSFFAVLSLAVFAAVVSERRYYPDLSFAFLALLALLWAYGIYAWIASNYRFWPYQDRTGIIMTSAILRLLVLTGLGTLMFKIFPKTSFGSVSRRHA